MPSSRVLILVVAGVLVPLAVLGPSTSPLVKLAAGLALVAAAIMEARRVAEQDRPRATWPALLAGIAVVVLVVFLLR